MGQANDKRRETERFRTMRYASVGLELALSVVVGLLIGHWLDGRFGTGPVLTIVFLVCGSIAGMRGLYRAAQRAMKEEEDGAPGDP